MTSETYPLKSREANSSALVFQPASRGQVSSQLSLSGMFRRSASLAIPHRKSFATMPSVSLGLLWGTGGILFREYCFGEENSLSSAANSVSSARNSVSSRLHTNNRPRGTH